MDGVEDAAAPHLWNKSACYAAADNADQVHIINLDGLEAETSMAFIE